MTANPLRQLKRAGVTMVLPPSHIGGSRMAQASLWPNVVEFIETSTGRVITTQMRKFASQNGPPASGRTSWARDSESRPAS